MRLPGLDELAKVSPAFAAEAGKRGRSVWTNEHRTARETAAAFIGCDLALNLTDLPFTLHTEMAHRSDISDEFIIDVMVKVASCVGYPVVAQALTKLSPAPSRCEEPATDSEVTIAKMAAAFILGHNGGAVPKELSDILEEYGSFRI